jgi:hypothetical protein
VIFRCRCGQEVRLEAELVELRLEARRKCRGSYDRFLTACLGFMCQTCARREVESRRPDPYLGYRLARLEGL